MIYSSFPFCLNSISVGNDNFIFSWQIDQNIYGQRVDINGNVHWEDNGVVIINENVSPYSKVDLSSNDDCFFVMYSTDENEEDCFSLKAQKINLEGSPEWDDSVILEEENTSSYFFIDSHIDDTGGCYFSWFSNSNIISQHLDSEGNKLWTNNGIELGIGFSVMWPIWSHNCLTINKIDTDIFCCWLLSKVNKSFLSYQCLDQDGTIQLPENGVDIREGLLGYIYNYQTVSNDNSSYHIWEDGRYPYAGRIFVQRVSSDGAIYFEDDGLALTDTTFTSQGYVTVKPLPENGIIAAWTEQKENEEFKRVRWQKVNENGNTFSENGVDLTVDIEYEQKNPKIEINDGNIIIAWLENEQIKAQKLVNDEPVWGNNGKVIVENCSIYYFSMIGNYFYWGLDDNMYFIMIDENGNIPVNWPVSGLPLPNFITHLYSMDVIEENLLFSYKSYQNGQRDYGIQILSSNAEYLFNGCGLTLYSDDSLNNLNVFFDGYINFVWRDYDYLNNYILMERFDLEGNSIWNGNIYAVESQGNIFRMESEKIGDNFFIVWRGNNENEASTFFMQSVDENGVPFQSNLAGVEFDNLSEDSNFRVSKLSDSEATILYQRGYFVGSRCEFISTGLVAQIVDATILTETIEETIQPCHIFLKQNFPNPFNPETTISFSLAKDAKNAKIEIYNIKGQKVKTLVNDHLQIGNHSIIWNGDDESGKPVGSGIYFYKLNVNGKPKAVKKCLLLK